MVGPWLDKLKGLFKLHFKADFRRFINIHKNEIHVHIGGPPAGSALRMDTKGNLIEINPYQLTKEERHRLANAIRDAAKEGYTLIESASLEKIDELKREEIKNADDLAILRPVIPGEDFRALRAAMFMRARFNAGDDVHPILEDISRTFGRRGRTIANLCSAGYFEELIIPVLCEMQSDPSYNIEKFLSVYRLIIQEQAFAVFVHGGMPAKEISKKIYERIEDNRKYGLGHVSIHGIGKTLVDRIRTTVEEAQKDYRWLTKEQETLVGSAIFVRLRFQNPPPLDLPPPSEDLVAR